VVLSRLADLPPLGLRIGGRFCILSTLERAGTWDDRVEAEAVAAELNERDRQPEYGSWAATTGLSSAGDMRRRQVGSGHHVVACVDSGDLPPSEKSATGLER
jgi:hypothetical protein